MTPEKNFSEAVHRLREARLRIEEAQERPASLESLQQWLSALTDYVMVLTDLQEYGDEALYEQLSEAAGRLGLTEFYRKVPRRKAADDLFPTGG